MGELLYMKNILLINIYFTLLFSQIVINELMVAPINDLGGQFSEYIELYNTSNEDINPGYMQEILQQHLPEGIHLISANGIPLTKTSLSQDLLQANWRFDLTTNLERRITLRELNSTIEGIKNAENLHYVNRVEGSERFAFSFWYHI